MIPTLVLGGGTVALLAATEANRPALAFLAFLAVLEWRSRRATARVRTRETAWASDTDERNRVARLAMRTLMASAHAMDRVVTFLQARAADHIVHAPTLAPGAPVPATITPARLAALRALLDRVG
jgi:hypothetical protein